MKRLALVAAAVLLLVGCGFKIPDCLKDGTLCQPEPGPSPSAEPPSPAPAPDPTPTPTPTPSPGQRECAATYPACRLNPPTCPRSECQPPSPEPSPRPTVTPGPLPSPAGPPALTESGNYPRPTVGECPAWFDGASSEVGIAVLSQRKCAGRDAPPDCTITNLHATEKSVKPFCEHSCYDEAGRYALSNCRMKCELWHGCQYPEFVDGNTGIRLLIAHPAWGDKFETCDKRTADCPFPDCRRNNICHDQAIKRPGITRAMACPPGVATGGPGCTTTEFKSLP